MPGTPWATEGWRATGLLHLSALTATKLPAAVARALDVVFDAATAFAHVRRLLVVGHLLGRPRATCEELVERVRMSPLACLRHLEKLVRRGYVREEGSEVWALARERKTPFHDGLLSAVTAWMGRPGQG